MVYIAGSATTRFGELFDRSLLDLLQEAITASLADANTSLDEIEAIYVSNMLGGALQNLQHLGSQLAGELGVNLPIYFHEAACASGGIAVHQAWKDVKAGYYQKVLVVGGEKMTELPPTHVNQYLNRAASLEEQMTGISFCGLYALMAQAYLQQYGLESACLSYGPALMHAHAQNNPHAHFYHKNFSLEQINQARTISEPLNLLHCSPLSDGASAVVLQQTPTSVHLTGSSVATDCPDLGRRASLTSIAATKVALERLRLSTNWREQCQLLELHDCFSIALTMALEDLGFCEAGKGTQYLKEQLSTHTNNKTGLTQKQAVQENTEARSESYKNIQRVSTGSVAAEIRSFSAKPEINLSGGLKAGGHPVGATGVKQIHSLYQRLKDLESGKTGLAQNIGGTGGTAVLHLLERC